MRENKKGREREQKSRAKCTEGKQGESKRVTVEVGKNEPAE